MAYHFIYSIITLECRQRPGLSVFVANCSKPFCLLLQCSQLRTVRPNSRIVNKCRKKEKQLGQLITVFTFLDVSLNRIWKKHFSRTKSKIEKLFEQFQTIITKRLSLHCHKDLLSLFYVYNPYINTISLVFVLLYASSLSCRNVHVKDSKKIKWLLIGTLRVQCLSLKLEYLCFSAAFSKTNTYKQCLPKIF